MLDIVEEQGAKPNFQVWPLSRVIYAITTVIAVTYFADWYEGHALSTLQRVQDVAGLGQVSRSILIAMPFLYILITGIAIAFFLPLGELFVWRVGHNQRRTSLLTQLLWGLLGGFLVLLLSAPLPRTSSFSGLAAVASFLSGSNSAYVFFPILVVMTIATAVCTEVLFRGVVFRTFLPHSNVSSSIMATCLVCTYVWPVYSPTAGIILSIVSCLLYYRTRQLLASIVANSVLILFGQLCSAAFHRLVR